MICGIDSNVLIYAGVVPCKGKQPAERKDLTVRAKLLLNMLRNPKEVTIILPAISLAELLVPVPPSQKGTLIAELMRRFVIAPFDLHASTIASELWANHKKLPRDQQYKDRNVLKSDVMILGSARAVGATKFYTNDKDCRALANTLLDGFGLPLPKRDPTDMYAADDIQRGEL